MAFGKKKTDGGTVEIKPANMVVVEVPIVGTAPYVQAKFAEKARHMMAEKMVAGSTAPRKPKREARDFDADFKGAQHRDAKNRCGIPCAAFRRAMIDACRTVGMEMTRAKMSLFVLADGTDPSDGTQIVHLRSADLKTLSPEPQPHEAAVRNTTGVADLRVRPMWQEWGAIVRIRFDADLLTVDAVVNLLQRAGLQIGVGEGRPFSKNSAGCNWGTFDVVADAAKKVA